MLKNYLLTAIRNLWRNRFYSAINIFGLAVGIACCILIFLYVQHEWSFDRFHKNGDQIYRLTIETKEPNGDVNVSTLLPTDLSEKIIADIPGVHKAAGYIRSRTRIVFEKESYDATIGLVDSTFLKIFTFPLLIGNPKTALSQPENVVITEDLAKRCFNIQDENYSKAIGKIIRLNRWLDQDFIVTGIMNTPPNTSSMNFNVLCSMKYWNRFGRSQNWHGAATVYIQLEKVVNPEQIEAAFPAFIQKYLGERIIEHRDYINSEAEIPHFIDFGLQPLNQVYFDREIASYYVAQGQRTYSFVLGGIALLVLFIACINFMTLSIGHSSGRSKEVSVRKVLGAKRFQLMKQFWGETLIMCFLALLFGIGLAELFLPVFNKLAFKNLNISYFDNLQILLLMVAALFVTATIAGSYPAAVLSGINPVSIFRKQIALVGRNRLTQILVVFQYALAIALMASTVIIGEQINFMRGKNPGYNKEQVVVVKTPNEAIAQRFKTKLKKDARIISVAGSDRSFTGGSMSSCFDKDDGEKICTRHLRVDEDFINTLEIELVAGRNFSTAFSSDSKNAVLINETLVKEWGVDNPIGKKIGIQLGELTAPIVVGIVKDFHIDALHHEIQPLVMHMDSNINDIWAVFVRIASGDMPSTIDFMRKAWESVLPNEPFQHSFLDDNLEGQYKNEERWMKILAYSSGFAILISCMGILGLSSLSVTRRTKEIGIRKVLGASAARIIGLICNDFSRLFIISVLIACPLAYLAMQQWLQNFAYRIEPGYGMFLFAGVVTILVALLTIILQALKAALSNPVDALRYE